LSEADWHLLEATRSLERFLDRSRTTSLRRFTDRLSPQMGAHAVERTLRQEWHRYVTEVAAWTPQSWQPTVLWVAHLPDLPVIDHLRRREMPNWAREDPIFAPFAGLDPQGHAATTRSTPLSALLLLQNGTTGLADRWLAHWRSLWPDRHRSDAQWLNKLVLLITDHLGRLARADVHETSSTYRRELSRALTLMFRRRAGTPVALFCYLALLALDLERLRGGLVRRRLLDAGYADRAA
jgi:hypothetical protein